jgi:biphenyl-2,3-diol 1,2-dioxygenase
MASVSQLGYAVIGVSDDQAWKNLATDVIGLELVPGDDRNTFYLRMDDYHHRLEVRNDGNDDLEVIGWQVPDSKTLHAVAQQLEDAGVRVPAATRDECDNRRVVEMFKCTDPSGIPTEVFYGQPINQKSFKPSRAINGFKAGDLGLGHMVVYQRNLEESIRFYRDLLGFRISDYSDLPTPVGKQSMVFFHCNPRHHSIAFVETPPLPKNINHIMLELNSLDDVGVARDICSRKDVPIAVDMGKHMNDHMVSFYMKNPSAWNFEYGWGGRIVDDTTWQVEHYTSVESIWGHPQLGQLISQSQPPQEATATT